MKHDKPLEPRWVYGPGLEEVTYAAKMMYIDIYLHRQAKPVIKVVENSIKIWQCCMLYVFRVMYVVLKWSGRCPGPGGVRLRY